MMPFSERVAGIQRVIQYQTMDDRLKNRLWNVAQKLFWSELRSGQHAQLIHEGQLLLHLMDVFFAMPMDDDDPFIKNVFQQVKQRALALEWMRFYDFIEFIANDEAARPFKGSLSDGEQGRFIIDCNEVLKAERSSYRFVGSCLTPLTNDIEIAEVERSVAQVGIFAGVAIHIKTALQRLGDRPNPDCRNSIKESISAVEAACQAITQDSKATVGQALKKLKIHPALEKGFTSIYGYTSDADGIRHALLEESTLDGDDAKFFLVACSAFANHLIARASVGSV